MIMMTFPSLKNPGIIIFEALYDVFPNLDLLRRLFLLKEQICRLDTTIDAVNQAGVLLNLGWHLRPSNSFVKQLRDNSRNKKNKHLPRHSQILILANPCRSKHKRQGEVQVYSDAFTVLSFTASHDKHKSTGLRERQTALK